MSTRCPRCGYNYPPDHTSWQCAYCHGSLVLDVGDRLMTTTDGATGRVLARITAPHRGYRVQWDNPRFGRNVSRVGDAVVTIDRRA